jgi:two-component system LytT family sensor kinase
MKLSTRIFWHAFFWVCVIAFFIFIGHSTHMFSLAHDMVYWGLYGVINVSLFYVNYLFLIPKFFNKKQYGLYILALFVTIFAYGVFKYSVGNIFEQDILMHRPRHGHDDLERIAFIPYLINTLFSSLIFLFLSFTLKLIIDWITNERIQRDLENQRLSAELAFLKSQINPHFLFNSLNSIYSLAYQKADAAPEAILKLSEIMRYMLYESNDNKVDLSKELQYIQNYIDLQKIRFGNKAYIDFKIEGRVTNQKIVPLLLIAFIENAFKHGVTSDTLAPIRLLITVDDSHLHFYIQNKKHTNNKDSVGGIGLGNVQRRLDLLYPGKYNLDIRNQRDTYICELSLIL